MDKKEMPLPRFRNWTTEEWAEMNEAQQAQAYAQARAADNKNWVAMAAMMAPQYPDTKFRSAKLLEYGDTLRYVGELMNLTARTAEVGYGGLHKLAALAGGPKHDLTGVAYLSQPALAFRLQNTQEFAPFIDHLHNIYQIAKENPAHMLEPVSLGMLAAQRTWQNAAQQYPWVRENPGDSHALGLLLGDPATWSMLAPAYKTMKVSKEVAAITPLVEGLRAAAARTGSIDAVSEMVIHMNRFGRFPASPAELVTTVRGFLARGATDAQIAQQVHLMGARAEETMLEALWSARPKIFKSGQDRWQDYIKDLGREGKYAGDVLRKTMETIRAATPDFSKGEMKYLGEVLHHIHTEATDPIKSFWVNHEKAISEGVALVDEAGKATGEKWFGAMPVDDGFKARINQVLDMREQGLYLDPERMIRSSTPRNASHGPSATYAQRVLAGDLEGAKKSLEQLEVTHPNWRLHQKHMGFLETREQLADWLATLGTRDMKVELEKTLKAAIQERQTVLTAAINKARPGTVAKELARLDARIATLEGTLAEGGKLTTAETSELSRNIRELSKGEKMRRAALEGEKVETQNMMARAQEELDGLGKNNPKVRGKAGDAPRVRPKKFEGYEPTAEGTIPPADAPAPTLFNNAKEAASAEYQSVVEGRQGINDALFGRVNEEGEKVYPGLLDELKVARESGANPDRIQELEQKALGMRNKLVSYDRWIQNAGTVADGKPLNPSISLTPGEPGHIPSGPEMAPPTQSFVPGEGIQPLPHHAPSFDSAGSATEYYKGILRDQIKSGEARIKELDGLIVQSKADETALLRRKADEFRNTRFNSANMERTNAQAELFHLTNRRNAISGNPDAIYNRAGEIFNDPTPKEQALYDAKRQLDDLYNQLHKLEGDYDPVREAAKMTKATEALLKAWDTTNGVILRILTTYNPIVWIHETGGKHIIRMIAETGDVHLKAVGEAILTGKAPHVLDALGNEVKVMGRSNDALFNPSLRWRPMKESHGNLLQRVKDIAHNANVSLETRLNEVDHLYQTLVKRHSVDLALDQQLKNGVPLDQAVKIANEHGERTLDRVLIHYRSKSPGLRILDRERMVASHVLNYTHNIVYHALSRPAEAQMFGKFLAGYRKHSVDGKGLYRIPGTDVGINALALTEPGKFYQRMSEIPDNMTDTYRRQYAVSRIASSIFGETNFLAGAVEEAVGFAPPASARPMGLPDELAHAAIKATAGLDIAPSDVFFSALGAEPGETRELRDARSAALYVGNHKRTTGENMYGPEAAAAVAKNNVYALRSMGTTGMPAVYMPKGYEESYGQIMRFNAAVQSVPEGPVRETIREMMRNHPDMKYLDHAVRSNEVNIFRAKERAGSPEPSVLDDLKSAVKKHWDSFLTGSVSSAGATEVTHDGVTYDDKDSASLVKAAQQLTARRQAAAPVLFDTVALSAGLPAAAPTSKWSIGPDSRNYVKLPGSRASMLVSSGDPAKLMSEYATEKAYQVHAVELNKRVGIKDNAEYIDSLERKDGTNPQLDELANRAPMDSQAAAILTSYFHVKNGVPVVGDLPSGIRANTESVATHMKNLVQTVDPKIADFIANGDPVKVADAFLSEKLGPLPYGMNRKAFDQYAVALGQNNARSGLVVGKMAWEQAQTIKYPAGKEWDAKLAYANQHDPRAVAGLIQEVAQAQKLGEGNPQAVPPNYLQDLRERNPKLAVDLAFSSHTDEALRLAGKVLSRDQRGNLHMNATALLEAYQTDPAARPLIEMMRVGAPPFGKETRDLFDLEAASLLKNSGGTIDMARIIPNDPDRAIENVLHNFDLQAGVAEHPVLRAFLNPPAQSTPAANVAMDFGRPVSIPAPAVPKAVAMDFTPTPMGSGVIQTTAQYGAQIKSQARGIMAGNMAMSAQDIPMNYSPDAPHGSIAAWGSAVSQSMSRGQTFFGAVGEQSKTKAGDPALNVQQQAYAYGTVATFANNMAGGNDDVNNALTSGLSVFAFHSALATIAPTLLATGPVGWVVAGGMGIAMGLQQAGVFGGKKPQGNYEEQMRIQKENLRINQERLDLQNKQFKEAEANQDIRDIRTREADLARVMKGGAQYNREAVNGHILNYQRKGTYASRVGLVDAIERELSSALKPRF